MDGKNSLVDHLSEIDDPRMDRTKRHKLIDILVIGVVGTLCGADSWEDVETIAEEKHEWLSGFLQLPNGVPSHDTISRVFNRIRADEFETCFFNWVADVVKLTNGEVVAIDGKRVRGSYDSASGRSAIHMVSAWAQENSVVLGQVKVDDKSNEITAIPKLLELLDLRGCIVTMDAMGCQTEIAEKIVEQKADFLLGLKGNQGNSLEAVELHFDTNAVADEYRHTTVDNDHGRIETREYSVVDAKNISGLEKWKHLGCVAKVHSTVEKNGQTTTENRYYLSSLAPDPERVGRAIRAHWSVENSLHWVLDVTFNEDNKRIRTGDGPENCSILRRIAINLLKTEKSYKRSLKGKKLKCCMSNKYLQKVLFSAD